MENKQLVWSSFTHNAVQKHFDLLGVKVIGFELSWGLQIQLKDGDDPRILKVTAPARKGTSTKFWTGHPAGAHAIRAIARIRCLQKVHRSRLDSESIEDVDVDASSQAVWKKWYKQLSEKDLLGLGIFRSGATKTNTRLHHKAPCAPCSFCGHALPSMRHLWQECVGFATLRQSLLTEFKLPTDFFTTAPRVTSKTGWITYAAAPTAPQRATMQIAACKLGICIITDGFTKVGHPGCQHG